MQIWKKVLDFKRSLTDKERAAAAREHWELYHEEWDPDILGRTNEHHGTMDQTLMMTPTSINNMHEYFDNASKDRENLRNLD